MKCNRCNFCKLNPSSGFSALLLLYGTPSPQGCPGALPSVHSRCNEVPDQTYDKGLPRIPWDSLSMSGPPLSHHFQNVGRGGRYALIWDLWCTKPEITLSPNRGTRLQNSVIRFAVTYIFLPWSSRIPVTHLRAGASDLMMGGRSSQN